MGFADYFYAADAFFAKSFLELVNGFVENVALAKADFFFRLQLKALEQFRDYFHCLLKVFFLGEIVLLEVFYVDKVVFEFLSFISVCAYDYSKKQVSAAGVVDGNGQTFSF